LFDVGIKKIRIDNSPMLTEEEHKKISSILKHRHQEVISEQAEENLHTEMQHHLLTIGNALGCDVISAVNDRSRCHAGKNFSSISLSKFPDIGIDKGTNNTIALIDIVWFKKGTNIITHAFEVEKSTSIYSGILRLTDLHHSFPDNNVALFLIIPDQREKELIVQLNRPSIRNNKTIIHYILFSDLRKHCDALCKFGESTEILKKISKLAV